MLRLTLVDQTDEETVLKVEGWVAEAEVGLLETEGQRYLQPGRRLVLELGGVRNIDPEGLALLRRWRALGVSWRNASPFIEALLTSCGLAAAGV